MNYQPLLKFFTAGFMELFSYSLRKSAWNTINNFFFLSSTNDYFSRAQYRLSKEKAKFLRTKRLLMNSRFSHDPLAKTHFFSWSFDKMRNFSHNPSTKFVIYLTIFRQNSRIFHDHLTKFVFFFFKLYLSPKFAYFLRFCLTKFE